MPSVCRAGRGAGGSVQLQPCGAGLRHRQGLLTYGLGSWSQLPNLFLQVGAGSLSQTAG